MSGIASAGAEGSQAGELELGQLIAAVRAREQFLEGILGSLGSLVTFDAEWRITFANETAARGLGRAREELVGTDIRELTPEDVLRQFAAPLAAATDGRRSVEFDVVVPDEGRTYRSVGYPLADGGLAVYARDVTAEVRGEQARQNEERLLALMDHNPSLIFLKDEEGRYVYLNRAYEERFVGSGDWPGKTDFDFWPAESAELFRANDAAVLASGEVRQFMEDSTGSDGRRYCWLNYKFPFTDAQGRRHVGGIGIDVTDRVVAEEALRESELLTAAQLERSRLARDLHDSVTQALFAATIKAEALTLDPAATPGVTITADEVRRLTRGALAQMRTLLLELRAEPLYEIPLQQLLRHLVEATESRTSTSVRLTVRGDAQLPPGVHVMLYRVAQEALNNVVRHAQAASSWVVLDAEPDWARLVVGDDGVGFDPARIPAGHLGLVSMRERAAEVCAVLRVTSSERVGTEIVMDWRAGD